MSQETRAVYNVAHVVFLVVGLRDCITTAQNMTVAQSVMYRKRSRPHASAEISLLDFHVSQS